MMRHKISFLRTLRGPRTAAGMIHEVYYGLDFVLKESLQGRETVSYEFMKENEV